MRTCSLYREIFHHNILKLSGVQADPAVLVTLDLHVSHSYHIVYWSYSCAWLAGTTCLYISHYSGLCSLSTPSLVLTKLSLLSLVRRPSSTHRDLGLRFSVVNSSSPITAHIAPPLSVFPSEK